MKKLSIYLGLAIAALTYSSNVEAQLSDRINNPSTFRTGTRPVTGNFAFYLGLEFDQFGDLLDDTTDVTAATPLINIKYYHSDDLVFRAGLVMWKKKRVVEGEIDTASVSLANLGGTGAQGYGAFYEHKDVSAYTLINIGVEKHFKASNMIDGYVGASLPLGYSRASSYTTAGVDGSLDWQRNTASRFSLVYGVELFVGMQLFIADLPLSIGTELGIKGIGLTGNKFKHTTEGSAAGVNYTGEYFTNNIDDLDATTQAQVNGAGTPTGSDTQFSSLKARSFDTQSMIRFTISYYFK